MVLATSLPSASNTGPSVKGERVLEGTPPSLLPEPDVTPMLRKPGQEALRSPATPRRHLDPTRILLRAHGAAAVGRS